MDYFAYKLQDMLINKTYKAATPKVVRKWMPNAQKWREISIPQFFPDLCVQWAIMQILEPVFTKGAYYYSCGNMPGKGTLFAKKTVEKWVQNDVKNTKYCLTMDIEKFYPSVNLGILKNMLRHKIKDRNILWLLDEIIDVQDKGLPIGYYSSTWLSNFLLQDLDHKIKEEFGGAKYYIRNVDDMLCFGANKRKLHKLRVMISDYLRSIGLKLKDNWQVFKYGVKAKHRHNDDYRIVRVSDFVGYRYFRDHTELRKRNALKIKRAAVTLSKKAKATAHQAWSFTARLGWSKHCNCYHFYQKYVKNIVDMKSIKEVIRYESRKRQKKVNQLYNALYCECSYFTG